MPQLGLDLIANGCLHGFVVDCVDMLIPGQVKNGDGIVYFKSPHTDYTLRGTWKNGKLDGIANLCYEKSYVVADISFEDGIAMGLCVLYDLSNNVVFHGFLYNGVRDGICIESDPETEECNYFRYEEGKVVSVIKPLSFHRNVFKEISTSNELLSVGCFDEDFYDYCGLFVSYKNNRPTTLSIVKEEEEIVLKRFDGSRMTEYDGDSTVVYKGDFIQNVKYLYPRHGKGEEFKEGHILVYSGDFANGYRHGHGTLYNNGVKRYEGGWELGEPSGEGTLFTDSGEVEFRGEFRHGCIVVGEGMTVELPGASAVFSSQYVLPKTLPQLSTILLRLSEQELAETRLRADPEEWWLDDDYGVSQLQAFEMEREKPSSPSTWKNRIPVPSSRKKWWARWKSGVLVVLAVLVLVVLAGVSYHLVMLALGARFVVSACDGQFTPSSHVRSVVFKPGVCSEPRDITLSNFSHLKSVVFQKGSFSGGGHVTIADNPRLRRVRFEEESFRGKGSLRVSNNGELSELVIRDRAFENATAVVLEENAELKHFRFGASSFRKVSSCSFVHLKHVASMQFGEESFYHTKSLVIESNTVLTTVHFGASSFHDLRSFRMQYNPHLAELFFDDNSCAGDRTNKANKVRVEPWDFLNEARFVDLPSLCNLTVRVLPERERGTSFMYFGSVYLRNLRIREEDYYMQGSRYGFFYYLNNILNYDADGMTKIIQSNSPWATVTHPTM